MLSLVPSLEGFNSVPRVKIHRPMRYPSPGGRQKSKYDRSGIENFDFLMDRFDNMIQRSKEYKLKCDFKYTNESFRQFVYLIGSVPEDMQTPTVGRKDHSKGYVVGNFEWQSKSDNCSEAAARTSGHHRNGSHVTFTCPVCGKSSNVAIMKRWGHGPDCQKAPA